MLKRICRVVPFLPRLCLQISKPNNLQGAVNLANHGKALTLTLAPVLMVFNQLPENAIKKNVDVIVIQGDHGNSIPTRLAFCS